MPNYFKFGMVVDAEQPGMSQDFAINAKSSSTNNEQERPNPYGKDWFDNPDNMAKTQSTPGRITSIPSPYARMHITDLAFKELNTGATKLTLDEMRGKEVSLDYIHAMSHCLDMYELFYYFDELDLCERGIRIERVHLVGAKDPGAAKLLGKNPNLRSYIETLDLYRKQYLTYIQNNRPGRYHFNFDTLYVFWDDEAKAVIGATSPFTGFFAKSTCNVMTKGPSPEARLKVNKGNYSHNLLTNNTKDWKLLQERPLEFRRFMYLLLKENTENLGKLFKNLFESVKMSFKTDELGQLDALDFNTEYPEYNFGNENLPKINSVQEAYLRTNDIDRSYLKYILYLYVKEPIDFKVLESAFKTDISKRVFPDNSDNLCPWICVNDFLADALFVLPYDINTDRYVAVPYEDRKEKETHNRCLLPIKREVLKYFPDRTLEEIAHDMTITKYEDGHFVVTYKVKLEKKDSSGNPVQVNLRREYWPNIFEFPNGILFEPKNLESFAFGIYPFVKSEDFTNIYKVLFYNKFDASIDAKDKDCQLDFYYFKVDKQLKTRVPMKFADRSVTMNYTGVYDYTKPDTTFNSIYYSIEEGNEVNRIKCIEFAELQVVVRDTLNKVLTIATSLIVPKLATKEEDKADDAEKFTDIAIDLGTSNSYIAYRREGTTGDAKEINTVHANGSELQFMNRNVTTDDYEGVKAKYSHDLYLKPVGKLEKLEEESVEAFNDRVKSAWTFCMPTQFCEFIPAHIIPQKYVQKKMPKDRQGDGFSFPIPTVINSLRLNNSANHVYDGDANVSDVLNKKLPLTHSSIPFAYYDIGQRPQGDTIEGKFKWFMNKNEIDSKLLRNLTLFVGELMFIVRSHMLCEGYRLDKCRIIWTYPLAFSEDLQRWTTEVWRKAYIKYFNPSLDYENDQSVLDKFVLSTNESLSPFFQCVPKAYRHDLTVLMDIGGSTTDVVGYDGQKVRFITSFGFAGDALYLNSEKNNEYSADSDNIYRYYLEKPESCPKLKSSQNKAEFGKATKPIQKASATAKGLAEFMNFGFQKFPDDMLLLYRYTELQYLLKFHLASIVYQTAQLCYWYSKGRDTVKAELPHHIYLTGNGSKLFKLLNEHDRMNLFTKMFSKAFGISEEDSQFANGGHLNLHTCADPKAATAQGALKAIEETGFEFNRRPTECVVMLGDASTVKKGNFLPDESEKPAMLDSVRANVYEFIDVFYDYLGSDDYELTDAIPKSKVKEQVKAVERDQSIFKIGRRIDDSLFFLYIARIMERISTDFALKKR